MKKVLSILLALVMLASIFSTLPVMSFADNSGSCGADVTYTIDEETKTLTISGSGAMFDYNTKTDSPFYQNSTITKIVIQEGVTSIGVNAFNLCSKVVGIQIPATITRIGAGAFSNCYYLASVGIPNKITAIEDSTFYYCTRLSTIGIPAGVTSIGNSAFRNCNNLTDIYYGGNSSGDWDKISIHETANDPLSASGVTIHYKSGGCGDNVFYTFVPSWSRLDVFGSGTMNDYLEGYPGYYDYRDDIRSIMVEDGVQTIGECAFYNLTKVKNIFLPASITQLGEGAFSECTTLQSLDLPAGITKIPSYAFKGCIHLQSMEIPEGVSEIGSYAFRNCESLASVTIPNTVTAIRDSAFYYCPALSVLVIPEGVKTIDRYAFGSCEGLTSVTLPLGLLLLHQDAFNGASDTLTFTASCRLTKVEPLLEGTNRTWNKVHEYKEELVAPDETEVGYTYHYCYGCHTGYTDTFTNPTGKVAAFKCAARTATAEKFTWSKMEGADGYQIQLTNAAGTAWSKAYSTAKTAYLFKGLTPGGKYKCRIRIFINAFNGKTYYGPWVKLTSPTLPAATTLKVTPAAKAFTAKWAKKAVTGYQLQYGVKSGFSGAKLRIIKGAKTYQYKVQNLKSGTNYYVRIRTYQTIGGKNYYSAWSKTIKVKTK